MRSAATGNLAAPQQFHAEQLVCTLLTLPCKCVAKRRLRRVLPWTGALGAGKHAHAYAQLLAISIQVAALKDLCSAIQVAALKDLCSAQRGTRGGLCGWRCASLACRWLCNSEGLSAWHRLPERRCAARREQGEPLAPGAALASLQLGRNVALLATAAF